MGFSWTTFLFEIVNFLALVWILHRVLYRPLREGIRKRRESLEQRESDADARRAAADEREQALAKASVEVEELRARTIRDATEQAAEERARLLQQAREDAAAERARAQRLLDAEREAAEVWVRQVAIEHAAEVAGRMLQRMAPEAAEQALFDRLLEELDRRADVLRSIAHGTSEEPEVEVTGARLPADASVQRLRERLARVLGRAPRLVLREDAALDVGLVLRVGHLVLDASMAGQLDAFRDQVRALLEGEAAVA